MSRIGRKPVEISSAVKCHLKGKSLSVEGPKGKLELEIHPRMQVEVKERCVEVTRPSDARMDRALHGLTRSLIYNIVVGVVTGYRKELEIIGIGYKAQVKEKVLSLNLGCTHPNDYVIPQGIEIKCPNPTRVEISGLDKQKVGQVAAEIRAYRPPEPYKGKGVRYTDEHVAKKEAKKK